MMLHSELIKLIKFKIVMKLAGWFHDTRCHLSFRHSSRRGRRGVVVADDAFLHIHQEVVPGKCDVSELYVVVIVT